MSDEVWRVIPDFPNYAISDQGRVWNLVREQEMKTSRTNYGHVKITLLDSISGERFTRSVAVLVAEQFVDAPNLMCDNVIILDGDQTNVRASNLAWRPVGFAWKYLYQLKNPQPKFYKNLPVMNVTTDAEYSCIIDAGKAEGLLFDDIWRSTYSWDRIFPNEAIFQVMHVPFVEDGYNEIDAPTMLSRQRKSKSMR